MRFHDWLALATTVLLSVPSIGNAYINAGFKSEAEARKYYRAQREVRIREQQRQLAILDEAIQRDPEDAVAHYQRARFHCNSQHQNWNLALADLDSAIRLKQNLAQAHFLRGMVHANRGNEVRCAADVEQALKLTPASDEYRLQLAVLYLIASDPCIRDLRKARQLAEERVVQNPTSTNLELAAAICAELGDFDSAVKFETVRWEGRNPNDNSVSNLDTYRRGETVPQFRQQLSDRFCRIRSVEGN